MALALRDDMRPEGRDLSEGRGVLACPRCRLQLAEGACSGCGDVMTREGALHNFIGAGTYICSADRDRELASWLIDNAELAAKALSLLESGHDRELTDLLGRDVSPEEFRKLEKGLPLRQILNNIGDYRADVRTTSPTIAFITRHVVPGAGGHIVDIGCSAGRHLLEWSASGAKLTGIDFRALGLEVAHRLWPQSRGGRSPVWLAGSITELPLVSASCSHAVCCVVLGLVPARRALVEIARVLEPGGLLVLTVEGPGFAREVLDTLPLLDRRRLALSRWWLARKLMQWGIDWQGSGRFGKLSSLTQFGPDVLATLARESGLVVERVEALSWYRGQERLVGLVARKPGGR